MRVGLWCDESSPGFCDGLELGGRLAGVGWRVEVGFGVGTCLDLSCFGSAWLVPGQGD